MTVSELERVTQRSAEWRGIDTIINTDVEQCVLDLIADNRLMRARLEGFRDGDLNDEVSKQAADTLADLRLEY